MLLSGTENHFPFGVLALTALRQTVETEKNKCIQCKVLHHLADLADAGFSF